MKMKIQHARISSMLLMCRQGEIHSTVSTYINEKQNGLKSILMSTLINFLKVKQKVSKRKEIIKIKECSETKNKSNREKSLKQNKI